jgi:hypothetical protein
MAQFLAMSVPKPFHASATRTGTLPTRPGGGSQGVASGCMRLGLAGAARLWLSSG